MRFLHTADWQIGTQFGQFTAEEAAYLTEVRFEAVRRIAALAAGRHVDAVIVAGDVFDQQTVSDTVIRKLFAALGAFSGPWFMLPGNHDAALAESVWTRAVRLGCVPSNVNLLLEPGVLSFDELGASLLYAPLTQRNTYEDTTDFFDRVETPAGHVRIGIAHGSVSGILQEGIDSANPLAPTRADTARLDYLVLGDWHGVYEVNPRIWYSGTPEQDRFRANEPGFVLDVRIDAPGAVPQVERVRVDKYRWSDPDAGHRGAELGGSTSPVTRAAQRKRRAARARHGQRRTRGCASAPRRHRGNACACAAFIDDGTQGLADRSGPRRARRAQRLSGECRRKAA